MIQFILNFLQSELPLYIVYNCKYFFQLGMDHDRKVLKQAGVVHDIRSIKTVVYTYPYCAFPNAHAVAIQQF